MENSRHPFERLTPDFIMDAVESVGYRCDCRTLALNSYENRVYQIGIEEGEPLIAKFYRPDRWTVEQIIEEHQFCYELIEQELPVVAPLTGGDNRSVFAYRGFQFALFPRKGGHAPEFDNDDNLLIIGRLLGRMHQIGRQRTFIHRPAISIEQYGHESVSLIRESFIPAEYLESYEVLTTQLLQTIGRIFSEAAELRNIRIHGDCHSGNMLWRDDNPHFVDFDDSRMGPAVQDLWMLLSGNRARQTRQLDIILEGYEQFCEFNISELKLIESLRTLRMLYFSAWLAKRWDDPAFPVAFPWFNTVQYWGEQILQLREQLGALQEPPLAL
ncbi:MAG: serine/threonine protein kinase [Desulfuromonas sp.]|nr:MAG: serine/threonine protein kinase [Desulfuromonas sp.]